MNAEARGGSSDDEITIETLRQALRSAVTSKEVTDYYDIIVQYGHIPIWIDDNMGEYPLRRQRIGELKADIGYAVARLYWKDEPAEAVSESANVQSEIDYTEQEFTLTAENVDAISRVLSDEDIE